MLPSLLNVIANSPYYYYNLEPNNRHMCWDIVFSWTACPFKDGRCKFFLTYFGSWSAGELFACNFLTADTLLWESGKLKALLLHLGSFTVCIRFIDSST